MAIERRKKRYPFRFEVVYDDGEGFMSGPVLDISETGCFIETVMPLAAGKKVRLTPLLPDEAGAYELEGEVVRAQEYDLDNHWERTPGMGIKFTGANPEFIEVLQKIFEQGAAPAA